MAEPTLTENQETAEFMCYKCHGLNPRVRDGLLQGERMRSNFDKDQRKKYDVMGAKR